MRSKKKRTLEDVSETDRYLGFDVISNEILMMIFEYLDVVETNVSSVCIKIVKAYSQPELFYCLKYVTTRDWNGREHDLLIYLCKKKKKQLNLIDFDLERAMRLPFSTFCFVFENMRRIESNGVRHGNSKYLFTQMLENGHPRLLSLSIRYKSNLEILFKKAKEIGFYSEDIKRIVFGPKDVKNLELIFSHFLFLTESVVQKWCVSGRL